MCSSENAVLSCFLRPLSSQVDTPASNLHIPPPTQAYFAGNQFTEKGAVTQYNTCGDLRTPGSLGRCHPLPAVPFAKFPESPGFKTSEKLFVLA